MSLSSYRSHFSEQTHDHSLCIIEALENANKLCTQRGARLTPLRRQVLELIWQSHKPLGAYKILEKLQNTQGGRAAPPTVYRALDFLLKEGLIHRIASLNAFIGCLHPDFPHVGQFFICQTCGNTAELDLPHLHADLLQQAHQLGFKVEKSTIELMGVCLHCQSLVSL